MSHYIIAQQGKRPVILAGQQTEDKKWVIKHTAASATQR